MPSYSERLVPHHPPATRATAGEPIIFIVDDDESVRDALKRLFRSVGLKVDMFGSAAELLRSKLPDVASCLRAHFEALTPREREVMGLVTAGMMNKQIAGELEVAEFTVKIHRGHIMRKMGARSLADLVRMAEALGVGGPSLSTYNRGHNPSV